MTRMQKEAYKGIFSSFFDRDYVNLTFGIEFHLADHLRMDTAPGMDRNSINHLQNMPCKNWGTKLFPFIYRKIFQLRANENSFAT